MDSTTRIRKPLARLSKSLTRLKECADPEYVHAMRTATRRVEALFAALLLDREKKGRKLLRSIAPLRKAAGRVRDLDVLIHDLLALDARDRNDNLRDLVELLEKRRNRQAHKLMRMVAHKQEKVRRRLKRWALQAEKDADHIDFSLNWEETSQAILNELIHWPVLDEDNLHAFRIAVKELRYILELRNDAPARLIHSLEDVKNAIGEWHDWTELRKIASGVPDATGLASTLKKIDVVREDRLRKALSTANRFRNNLLK